MDTFDRLIKEKVAQQQYAYKPSAWKSFCRTAGIKRGFTILQTIGIIAAVGIISSGLWMWIDSSIEGSVSPVQSDNSFTETIAIQKDTLSLVEEKLSITDSFETHQPTPATTLAKPPCQTLQQETLVAPIQQRIPSTDSIIKEGKWQISIINPDTIKEN